MLIQLTGNKRCFILKIRSIYQKVMEVFLTRIPRLAPKLDTNYDYQSKFFIERKAAMQTRRYLSEVEKRAAMQMRHYLK